MDVHVTCDAAHAVFGSVTFHLHGIDASVFNLLRHALFKDVPVLAADTVTFVQYDGPLEPEMISHRIGQIPLRFIDGACPPSGTATFELDVTTDRGKKGGLTWLTSFDVKCVSGNAEIVHYRTERERELACGDLGFLLAPLHPGQRLKLQFQAKVSTGREATRWVSTHCIPKFEPHHHITVETTGAITPRAAMISALKDVIHKLKGLLI